MKNANNTNIKSESKTKTSPKKTENVVVKKVGRPKTQDAASDHPTSNSVPREADKLVPSKVDISGRRVSTRSKKPGDLDRELFIFQFYLVLTFLSIQQNWCSNKSLCFTPKRIIWIP